MNRSLLFSVSVCLYALVGVTAFASSDDAFKIKVMEATLQRVADVSEVKNAKIEFAEANSKAVKLQAQLKDAPNNTKIKEELTRALSEAAVAGASIKAAEKTVKETEIIIAINQKLADGATSLAEEYGKLWAIRLEKTRYTVEKFLRTKEYQDHILALEKKLMQAEAESAFVFLSVRAARYRVLHSLDVARQQLKLIEGYCRQFNPAPSKACDGPEQNK